MRGGGSVSFEVPVPTQIVVKGPLGTLTQALSETVRVKRDADRVVLEAANDSIKANAMSGTHIKRRRQVQAVIDESVAQSRSRSTSSPSRSSGAP